MMSSNPRYVVECDWQGPYVLFVPLGRMHRTWTVRGAIWKAKRLNREDERQSQPPVRVWPKDDES